MEPILCLLVVVLCVSAPLTFAQSPVGKPSDGKGPQSFGPQQPGKMVPPAPPLAQTEPEVIGGPPRSFGGMEGPPPPPPPPPMGPNMVVIGPPPMLGCVDQDSNMKSVNDTCTMDEECGWYSMECVNKRCACRDNFVATKQMSAPGGDQFTCVALPSMRQPCSDRCQPPLTCALPSNGSDSSFPSFPPFAPMPMMRPADSMRVCSCQSPAIYSQNTGTCYLECPSDQIYSNGKCHPRCAASEVKVADGKCLKKAALGEKCDHPRQCTSAYSECSQGTCHCKNGFTAGKDGKCATKSYSCPVGEPISANGAVVSCEIVKAQNRSSSSAPSVPAIRSDGPGNSPFMYMPPPMGDTCGEGQYCVVYGGVPNIKGARGHCCPKQKPACPIGEPHPNATCGGWMQPGLAGTAVAAANRCPRTTHYCIHSPGFTDVCCPLACPTGFVFADGQCLPQLQHGDSCSVDAQCRLHNGICQSGTCACGPKMSTEGTVTYKYCTLRCKPDEIIVDNECRPRLKLGDHCDPSSADQHYCPMNAFCNKEKVCACRCAYGPIGDRLCGPPPKCGNPAFGGGRPVPMPMPVPLSMAIREATDSGNDDNQTTTTAHTTSAPKNNFTFCKTSPDTEAPLASAVDQCADGQYCSYYMPTLGVCCPKPKPSCPPGDTLKDQKCEPRIGCGVGAFCYRYFTPANSSDTSAGFVCCSFGGRPTPIAGGGPRPVG